MATENNPTTAKAARLQHVLDQHGLGLMAWHRQEFGWFTVEHEHGTVAVWPYADEPTEEDHENAVVTLGAAYRDRLRAPEQIGALATPSGRLSVPIELQATRSRAGRHAAVYRLV